VSLPVIEQIAQEIESTLNEVKECNDYTFDLSIQRAKRKTPPTDHCSGIIYQDDPVEVQDEIYDKKGWLQSFFVNIFIRPAEGDTRPIDYFVNCIVSDMTKALHKDYTRGGLAVDTIIREHHIFEEVDGTLSGFVFQFDVKYRTDIRNPEIVAA
jgi:hypothetical protein